MARRKMEQLRDDVIAAATTWAHGDLQHGVMALINAVYALDCYITPIIDSPGEYVEGSPETSRNAALAVKLIAGSMRRKIVNEIAAVHFYGQEGLTDSELEHRLRGKHQTVSSARNWLVNAGWLVDSGFRRTSPSQRAQVIWTFTVAGRDAARELPQQSTNTKGK